MLPSIRNGGGLRGYQVYAKVRGKFRAVDPRSVNWRKVDARSIQIRQPPGARNALGEVKFLFPNQHDVYLHDTPSKSLFERDVPRLQPRLHAGDEPVGLRRGAALEHRARSRRRPLRKQVGGGESWVNLDRHIPVHITYFTAWVDDDGKLQVRDDVYGHDKRLGRGPRSRPDFQGISLRECGCQGAA